MTTNEECATLKAMEAKDSIVEPKSNVLQDAMQSMPVPSTTPFILLENKEGAWVMQSNINNASPTRVLLLICAEMMKQYLG